MVHFNLDTMQPWWHNPIMLPSNKDSTEGSAEIQQISVRIPVSLWERLGHLAITLKTSKAQLIIEALENFLSGAAKQH